MSKTRINLTADIQIIDELKRLDINMSELFEESARSRLAVIHNEINYFDLIKYERERKELQSQNAMLSGRLKQIDLIIEQIKAAAEKQKTAELESQQKQAAMIMTCTLCGLKINDAQKKEKSLDDENGMSFFHHTDCMLNKRFIVNEKEVTAYEKLEEIKQNKNEFLNQFKARVMSE